jgi:hypothetical protein
MVERDIRRLIQDLGGRVTKLRCNKHWVGQAEIDGLVIPFTISASASDYRAFKNIEGDIRKSLRIAKERANV